MILVRAPTTPAVEGRPVDVRPGLVTTFAGDRPRSTFHVMVADHDVRETYPRDRFADVVGAAQRLLREYDATVIRLGNRRPLWSFRPASTVRDLEQRFAAAATAEGATLLTWTDDEPRPDDSVIYDRIIRYADASEETGEETGGETGGETGEGIDGRTSASAEDSDVSLVEETDARPDHPP